MRKKVFLTIIVVFFSIYAIAQEGCRVQGLLNPPHVDCADYEHGDWILVFEEDFDDNQLNKDIWFTCEDGWNRVHGEELQYYKDDNIKIQNGILHLEALEEPGIYEYWDFLEDGTPYLTSGFFQYTSGWIQTKKNFLYGKIEAKCKIPWGDGFWPAFWMYGNGYELDIFEFQGHNPFICHFNVHRWKNGHISCGDSYEDNHYAFSNDYHIYSVEWDEFYLTYRIDGVIRRKISRFSDLQGRTLDNCNNLQHEHSVWDRLVFPRNPMSVIINLAISSGNYGAPPNSSTIFPSSLDIDYVKVYKRNNYHRQVIINEQYDSSLACYTGGDIRIQGVDNMLVIDSCDRLSFFATHEIEIAAETEIRSGASVELSIVSTTLSMRDNNEEVLEEIADIGDSQNKTLCQDASILISPNPSDGFFTVVLNDSQKEYSRLLIISNKGETVYCSPIGDKKNYSLSLNLPSGIYSIVAEGPLGCLTNTLIVK